MFKILKAIFIITTLIFVQPIYAQIVTLHLKDGSKIVGELKGFEEGYYIIETDGKTEKIKDSNVIDVTVLTDKYSEIRNLIDKKDFEKAGQALKELLDTDSSDKIAKQLLQELESARFKDNVMQAKSTQEKIKLLEDAIPNISDPDLKKWATAELDKAKAGISTPIAIDSALSYFPIKQGLWYKYRRGDRYIEERLEISSVSKDEDITHIYFSQARVFKTQRFDERLFQLDMDSASIHKPSSTGDIEILFKFPIKVGESWAWKDKSTTYTRTYKSVTEVVETPAGKFKDCLLVEFCTQSDIKSAKLDITSKSYYAPGIGLVKLEMVNSEYSDYNMELIEYGVEDTKFSSGK